jgi:dTDP-4-dehydrorhamnose reductase
MSNKKVVVIGASGIVGQHMMLTQPSDIDVVYTRRTGGGDWIQLNVGVDDVNSWLDEVNPDVIVNLAGQNIVDVVEGDPNESVQVNVNLPLILARWSDNNNKFFIQGSTQGIFSGNNPDYTPESKPHPVTWYGKQKAAAEKLVLLFNKSEIVRLTFVIGVRPNPNVGRKNPLEMMMEQPSQLQVDDRFFSPVFAYDAAAVLWDRVGLCGSDGKKIVHVGNPIRCSRYSLVSDLKIASDGKLDINIEPVSYTHFISDVPRPRDTTWKEGTALYKSDYMDGLKQCYLEWEKLNK